MSSLSRSALASPAGREPPGLTWGAVRRRAWIPLAAILLVTLTAVLVTGLLPRHVVTESVVVVRSGSGAAGPGAATEATRLAVTYAASIPDDAGLLYEAASRLRTTPESVSDAIEVRVDPDTALLRIRFEGPDTRQAMGGATAILDALTSPTTGARSVPVRSLVVVQGPRVVSGTGTPKVLPVGVVLGLFLGLVLAVAWERADPRIDDSEQLAAALDCPAMGLATMFPGSAAALLRRWRESSPGRAPTIALLAATSKSDKSMPAVAERLRQALNAGGSRHVVVRDVVAPGRERPVAPRDGAVLLVSGMPGRSAFADHAAATADVVVVVVSQAGRVAEVRSVRERLVQLSGKAPDWGLLVSRSDLRTAPPAAADVGVAAASPPEPDALVGVSSSRPRAR